jgi:hypothetical protein
MATAPKPRPKGPWTPEEIARHERVEKARAARDREGTANLEEGLAPTRFAQRFADAFKDVRLEHRRAMESADSQRRDPEHPASQQADR